MNEECEVIHLTTEEMIRSLKQCASGVSCKNCPAMFLMGGKDGHMNVVLAEAAMHLENLLRKEQANG